MQSSTNQRESIKADAGQPSPRRLLSIPDALPFLPFSREHIYRMVKRGDVPSYRLGRRVVIDLEEVLQAMRQGARS